MQRYARNHVPAVTGALTIASLAFVFGAVLGVIPAGLFPRASDAIIAAIPHANAVISVLAIAAIVLGWRWIRAGYVDRHRYAMLAAFVLFALFLLLYLYRITMVGQTHFAGPDAVRLYVYLPVLAVHVALAIVCIPLLYYVLLLAVTRPVAELRTTLHPRIGRYAAVLWLTSFVLGLVVYGLLYLY